MMRVLKNFIDFYLHASIHVAVAAWALVQVTLLGFDLPYDKAAGYVTFCATVVSYNFMKYGTTARKYIIVSSGYVRLIQGISFLCFGIGVFYAFQLRIPALAVLAAATVLAALYALPFLPGHKSFRSLHGLKIYMVALCWCLVTVLFPVVNAGLPLSRDVYIAVIQRFIFILVLVLPFDIRDLKYDELSLGTLPQQIGIKKTKWAGILLLLLFYGLGFLREEYTAQMLWVNGIVVGVTGLLVGLSKKEQPEYYSSIYVESVPLLWWALLMI